MQQCKIISFLESLDPSRKTETKQPNKPTHSLQLCNWKVMERFKTFYGHITWAET